MDVRLFLYLFIFFGFISIVRFYLKIKDDLKHVESVVNDLAAKSQKLENEIKLICNRDSKNSITLDVYKGYYQINTDNIRPIAG